MTGDEGVSEIVSCILILAVIAAAAAIVSAAVLPELEKAERLDAEDVSIQAFAELKSGIDQLWISERTEFFSLLLQSSGTLNQDCPTISFSHTGGETSAALLSLTYETSAPPITYEGGAVFWNQQTLFSASAGETHAVLIVAGNTEETIAANRPLLLRYACGEATTYTNVSAIQITSEYDDYWKETLENVETLTLVECTVIAEASV